MSAGTILRETRDSHFVYPPRVFGLLVVYRWVSLIPPLVALILALTSGERTWGLPAALAVAGGINIFITLFYARLNRALLVRPWLLAIDIVIVVSLTTFTGGWRTPFLLYALNPLLAAAFFFRLPGALVAVTGFSALYSGAVLLVYRSSGESPGWQTVVTALVGFYLITITFGYASRLVQGLRVARDELAEAHRDLQVIHDLTLSLQSAADVVEVEERVLEAVTRELGFSQAVVGLVDGEAQTITAWMGRAGGGDVIGGALYLVEVPLSTGGGPVSQALLQGQAQHDARAPFTNNDRLNEAIGLDLAHVFPLMLRENPIGILLVDAGQSPDEAARFRSLEAIANQAAVTLGTTMMCIDRAQRMAIQEERVRIARDIHDTVSQSLFGITYTLDGSLKLLGRDPQAAVPELERALRVAEETRAEIRKSILDIWPSEMTAHTFVSDLRKFADGICLADELAIEFQIDPGFDRLPSRARRSLYRISQEALANVSHHANAGEARVCLQVSGDRAMLTISDNGRGFEVATALAREYGREHFGLWGMQERARSLGGTCEINSRPGAGTSIVVDVPV
jgi:signal transduction histidine kinase